MARAGAALMLVVVMVGCGKDPLADDEMIGGWANAASALGVFTHAYEPLAFADGEVVFADATCPTTSDDGTVATIDGGDCIDSEGDQFFGGATVERTANGGRLLTLTRYGHARDGGPVGLETGTVTIAELGADLHSFDVDLFVSGGLDTDIVYAGTVEGGYDGATIWNGEGTVERSGGAIHDGSVHAPTVDQLRDNDICAGEGISGTTTLVSDEHTVVITYDGAEDCDDDTSARWSRDGEDQGLLPGVSCAIGHPARRDRRGGGAWVIAALALVVRLRAPRSARRERVDLRTG